MGPENQKWALRKNGKYSYYRDRFPSPVKENIYIPLVGVWISAVTLNISLMVPKNLELSYKGMDR